MTAGGEVCPKDEICIENMARLAYFMNRMNGHLKATFTPCSGNKSSIESGLKNAH